MLWPDVWKSFSLSWTDKDRKEFLYSFFPFLFGIHPFTTHTEKQLAAMKQAGIKEGDCTWRPGFGNKTGSVEYFRNML